MTTARRPGAQRRIAIHQATPCWCEAEAFPCERGLDCPMRESELACDIGPDEQRVIQPPAPTPEPNWRARAASWALAISIALYLAVAMLLRLCGSRSV